MKTLRFSNGVIVDASQIVAIESNQQTIDFPAAIGELDRLLKGRPGGLLIRLKDGSKIDIAAGQTRLQINESDISFD